MQPGTRMSSHHKHGSLIVPSITPLIKRQLELLRRLGKGLKIELPLIWLCTYSWGDW